MLLDRSLSEAGSFGRSVSVLQEHPSFPLETIPPTASPAGSAPAADPNPKRRPRRQPFRPVSFSALPAPVQAKLRSAAGLIALGAHRLALGGATETAQAAPEVTR